MGPENRLTELRSALLTLHRAIIESERVSYEKTVEKFESPNHFLQLLTNDPWFGWLQPLSQLIVAIDEALEAEEPLTDSMVDALAKQTGLLWWLPRRRRFFAPLFRRIAGGPGCHFWARGSNQTAR